MQINDELIQKKQILEYMQSDSLGFKVNKKLVAIAVVLFFFIVGLTMGRINRTPKTKKPKRKSGK